MSTLSIDEMIGIARQAKSLMHRDELAWLLELARLAPNGTGVEVGVYCGASLIAWSLMRQGRGESIGVDNWSYQDEYIDRYIIKGQEHNGLRLDGLRGICETNIKRALDAIQLPDSTIVIHLLDGPSVEIAQQVTNGLAFVFIDGDHTSPAIDNDIVAWSPKLMHNGILAFHDYGRRKNGCRVTQAVDNWQMRDRWHEMGKVDTTIGYRKPYA